MSPGLAELGPTLSHDSSTGGRRTIGGVAGVQVKLSAPSSVTVAEFWIELGPEQPSGTWKVTFNGGRDTPDSIVPREQGKPWSQGLSALKNVTPDGGGSLRVTPVAVPPLLVT